MALLLPFVLLLVAALILRQLGTGKRPGATLSVTERLAQARAQGEPAPAFELTALDGEENVSLREFAGRVVVLNFWASWCEPCRREAPHLQAAWEEYGTQGVQFLGVNHLDKRAAALAFQREFGITFPSGFDPNGRVATDYGLAGIPSTFVIDRDGRLAYRFLGRVDVATLRAAVKQVLGGATR